MRYETVEMIMIIVQQLFIFEMFEWFEWLAKQLQVILATLSMTVISDISLYLHILWDTDTDQFIFIICKRNAIVLIFCCLTNNNNI